MPGRRAVLGWRVLGALLALPVHAVTLVAAAGGLVLLVTGDNWVLRALGLVLLLVAVATRPVPMSAPDSDVRIARWQAPHLFALVDAVAEINDAPTVDEIVILDYYNALAAQVGWRRRRLLGLGAPLWVACPPQARVALVGHELGHFAHSDPSHGWWVGSAQESLLRWWQIAGGEPEYWDAILSLINRILLAPVRGLIVGYLVAITWVNAPARQRQELLADLDALRAAGTEGAIDLLDVLLAEPAAATAMTRAVARSTCADMWQEVSASVALSTLDPEQLREHASSPDTRIDDAHPATRLRLQLVQSRPAEPAAVLLDADVQSAIDAELESALALAAKATGDRIRYALHMGAVPES